MVNVNNCAYFSNIVQSNNVILSMHVHEIIGR